MNTKQDQKGATSRTAGAWSDELGKRIITIAENMARFSAERSTTRDCKEHPMFGIAVDKDQWAVCYQKALAELKEIVGT